MYVQKKSSLASAAGETDACSFSDWWRVRWVECVFETVAVVTEDDISRANEVSVAMKWTVKHRDCEAMFTIKLNIPEGGPWIHRPTRGRAKTLAHATCSHFTSRLPPSLQIRSHLHFHHRFADHDGVLMYLKEAIWLVLLVSSGRICSATWAYAGALKNASLNHQ